MPRIYIYKMIVDIGAAPCVWDGVLSLAICKPKIRAKARKNDIILGFAANSLSRRNRLIYMAKVTKPVSGRKYFSTRQYQNRPDCIYQFQQGRFDRKTSARFHSPQDMKRDLGEAPAYKSARVLLSKGENNFRYFGRSCPIDYKTAYPRIRQLVETLARGHRVNHSSHLRAELEDLVRRLWKATPAKAAPSVSNKRSSSARDDDNCVVVTC